jgi:hypothetical protein
MRWHRIAEPIIKLGGKIIALSCDTYENSTEAKKKWGLKDFDILSDPDLILARHLHLVVSKGPKGMFPKGMNEAGTSSFFLFLFLLFRSSCKEGGSFGLRFKGSTPNFLRQFRVL